jgi:Ca2+-binding EF-hand superfamily protein
MHPSRVIVLMAGLAIGIGVQSASAQSKAQIQQMDRDNDGVVTRAEWQGQAGAFRLHDTNKDGVLSAGEVWDNWSPDRNTWIERFSDLDVNNDGAITRNEWRDSVATFRDLDRNRDNRLSRAEFRQFRDVAGTAGRGDTGNRDGNWDTRTFPNAYMAGYERGWSEGHAAGREDRDRNQGWDLEGQRELETADSGYNPRFGSKPQYQQGYRDGFRAAYGEGWDRR